MKEGPLVAFTLAVQAAAGAYAVLAGMQLASGGALTLLALPTLLALALLVLAGMAASLLHLGAPHRAHRALYRVRTSWLSREVLAAALFAGGLAAQAGAAWQRGPGRCPAALLPLVALVGLALVYCMARAYMLRTVAAWHTPAVLFSFLASTAILGALLALVLAPAARAYGWPVLALLVVAAPAEVALGLWRLRPAHRARTYGDIRAAARASPRLQALHMGLLALAVAWTAWALGSGATLLPALALAVAAEVAGRVQFYRVWAR